MPLTIIVALLAIAATLFGILANHRLTLWRTNNSEFIRSADTFRDVLLAMLQELKEEKGYDTVYLFDRHFPEQKKSAVSFRLHLKYKWTRRRFDKAWREYSETPEDYADFGCLDKRQSLRMLARNRIHVLLRFTGYNKE